MNETDIIIGLTSGQPICALFSRKSADAFIAAVHNPKKELTPWYRIKTDKGTNMQININSVISLERIDY